MAEEELRLRSSSREQNNRPGVPQALSPFTLFGKWRGFETDGARNLSTFINSLYCTSLERRRVELGNRYLG